MMTLTLRAEIDDDGVLRIQLPGNFPPGPAEVVVVVQPDQAAAPPPASVTPRRARSGLFAAEQLKFIDLNIDLALEEMSAMRKARIADINP